MALLTVLESEIMAVVRAAQNGRSTEAEIRDILEKAAQPPERIKLGTLLASFGRDWGGLTDDELAHFDQLRDQAPADPMRFE